jgi:hypothetical protein
MDKHGSTYSRLAVLTAGTMGALGAASALAHGPMPSSPTATPPATYSRPTYTVPQYNPSAAAEAAAGLDALANSPPQPGMPTPPPVAGDLTSTVVDPSAGTELLAADPTAPPSPVIKPGVSVDYDGDNKETTVTEIDPKTGNVTYTLTVRNMSTGMALMRAVDVHDSDGNTISSRLTTYGTDSHGAKTTTDMTTRSDGQNTAHSEKTTTDPSNKQLMMQTDQTLGLGIAQTAAASALNQVADLLR